MRQSAFIEKRSQSWERLDALATKAGRKGVRGLGAGDADELGRLYRAATSDLSYARGREFDPALVEYLNRLAARAHAYVYGGSAQTGGARISAFYRETFPREFRRSFAYVAICTAVTVAFAVVAFAVVRAHPAAAYSLLPSQLVPDEIRKSLHDSNFAFDHDFAPAMSAAIITNNIRVAIAAFAGSVTLGALTLYIIAYNGLMLGGMGALFTNAGFGYDFWATIAPHGAIELTAIQIAGAAGLLIAAGVLYPGRLRRKEAIVRNARRAGTLIAGVASMLVVAGTIEGFISPQRWPPQTRVGFGALTAVALVLYFGFSGRHKRKSHKQGRSDVFQI
ncbi:MAG: stage II sporulation protein M [Candidatus Tumulicola sp.]